MIRLDRLYVYGLIGASVLFHIMEVPEILKAFVALPSLILMPYYIGSTGLLIFKDITSKIDYISLSVLRWLTGIYIIFIVSLTSIHFNILTSRELVLIFLGVLILYTFISNEPKISEKIDGKNLLGIVGSFTFGLVPIIFVKSVQPFQLLLSYGVINYHYHTLRFIENNILLMEPSRHIPIIPILSGIIAIIHNIYPLSLYWAAPFVLYPIFTMGVYILSYKIYKHRNIALLSSFIAPWLLSLQVFQHLHAFIARSILFALFPYVLYILYENKCIIKKLDIKEIVLFSSLFVLLVVTFFIQKFKLDNCEQIIYFLTIMPTYLFLSYRYSKLNRKIFFSVTVLIFTILLIHNYEGIIYFVLLTIFILSIKFEKEYFVYLLLIGTFIYISFQYIEFISFRDNFIFSKYIFGDTYDNTSFDLDFKEKYDLLLRGFNYYLISIVSIGFIAHIKDNRDKLIIVISTLVAILIYFLPEGHFHRIIGPTITFLSIILSIGIIKIYSLFKSRNKHSQRITLLIISLVISLLIIPNIYPPLAKQLTNSPAASYSNEDVIISKWVNENVGKNYTIISDPITMFLVEGLSNRKQPITRAWIAKKEYTTEDINKLENLKNVFGSFNNSSDHLKTISNNNNTILIINSRTIHWISTKKDLIFLTENELYDISNNQFIVGLMDDTNLVPLHRTNKTIILNII